MRRIDKNHGFSHSLVNNYERWLNSESEYNRFYRNSENPQSPDEFDLNRKLNFYAQLFKIEFLPEYEQDDTSIVLGKKFEDFLNTPKSTLNDIEKLSGNVAFNFKNNRDEAYSVIPNADMKTICENRIKNKPTRQVEIRGILPNGLNFIGYADEVYDNCIIDIKTTSNFSKSNYDNSLQIALYIHFLDDYAVRHGFYQVTEFYRSKASGKREFAMKDTFMIESERITENQLSKFSEMCAEILKNAHSFEVDLLNYRKYFKEF